VLPPAAPPSAPPWRHTCGDGAPSAQRPAAHRPLQRSIPERPTRTQLLQHHHWAPRRQLRRGQQGAVAAQEQRPGRASCAPLAVVAVQRPHVDEAVLALRASRPSAERAHRGAARRPRRSSWARAAARLREGTGAQAHRRTGAQAHRRAASKQRRCPNWPPLRQQHRQQLCCTPCPRHTSTSGTPAAAPPSPGR
jgi:hypothetical protein